MYAELEISLGDDVEKFGRVGVKLFLSVNVLVENGSSDCLIDGGGSEREIRQAGVDRTDP